MSDTAARSIRRPSVLVWHKDALRQYEANCLKTISPEARGVFLAASYTYPEVETTRDRPLNMSSASSNYLT